MKTILKSDYPSKSYKTIFIVWIICVLLHISFNVLAQNPPIAFTKEAERLNAVISAQTKTQLLACRGTLNYPKSVERFYKQKKYTLAWVEKMNHNRQLAPAMMILDCVKQFGLNAEDFHTDKLIYEQVTALSEQPDMLGGGQRAIFDVLLTDAMITFMNHLHYGKFNLNLTPAKIDEGVSGDFNAETKLAELMDSKDFYNDIARVQPSSRAYEDLQKYMHLVRGQYLEDSYDFPEQKVRKMTINMERLRWLSAHQNPSLLINIPAYTAKLNLKDSTYIFKVIVGKATSPTPLIESEITSITTFPDKKVAARIFVDEILPQAIKNPAYINKNHYEIYGIKGNSIALNNKKLRYIKAHPQLYYAKQLLSCDNSLCKVVFQLANSSNIYLHDHTQQNWMLSDQSALTTACIYIDQAEKLAGLMMLQDGSLGKARLMRNSIKNHQTADFKLIKALPVKITYLTCEMIDSQLVIYNDIYLQDRALEMAMYGYERLLASDKKIISRH